MPLPEFDSGLHHVGLGPAGGTQYGLFVEGGYRRQAQRYGFPVEFGGERDLTSPTVHSRWTQDDFAGGGYAEMWGGDPAMFAFSQNMMPSPLENTALTLAPLVYFTAAGQIDGDSTLGMIGSGFYVAMIDADAIRWYHISTGALVTSTDPAYDILAAAHDPTDNYTYGIRQKTSDSTFWLDRWVPGNTGNAVVAQLPTAFNGPVRGMEMTAGRDIVISGMNVLWLADVNDARSAATFIRIGRLPGSWRDSVTYNGLTYILLTDGENLTQVVAWDGSQILPIAIFPSNFIGNTIREYGGRLFVGGTGYDITGTETYAELYEMTGSSLRLIRSFAHEARAGFDAPTTIYEMNVHEMILFCGTDKGYCIAYDITRDALWPGVQVVSKTNGRTLQVRRLLSTRARLFAWCYDPNRTNPEDGFYRLSMTDADLDDADSGGQLTYDSYVETSDFGPELDRGKRWATLRVLTRYTPNPTLEYSQDGGSTWDAASGTTTGTGNLKTTDFDLSSVPVSTHIRFRINFSKQTVAYTELIGFTLSFLFLDTGKRAYTFTVLGVDRIEAADESTQLQDVAALDAELWGWWEDKELLDFTDLDGSTRTVIVTDVSDARPVIGPSADDGSREGLYYLTLTEV